MNKQSGMSLYVLSFWIGLAVFFGALFAKLMPVYVDHYYLNGFYEDVIDESRIENFSKSELFSRLEKRLMINNVDNIELRKITKFENDQVIVEFESRTPVMFNIDAVIKYEKTYSWIPG